MIRTTAPSIHERLKIKTGGASTDDVRKMLGKADANGDGVIDDDERTRLGEAGAKTGFADQDAKRMFQGGLDAAALTAQKRKVAGEQLSKSYFEQRMEPLVAPYGKPGEEGARIVTSQATSELTDDGARHLEDRSGFGDFAKKAMRGVLTERGYPDGSVVDKDGDGRPSVGDAVLYRTPGGKMARTVLDQRLCDEINTTAGITEASELLHKNGGPKFPSSGNTDYGSFMGGNPAWKVEDSKDGVQWRLDTSKQSASKALDEYKADPSKYTFDCTMAEQMNRLMGLRQALGDKKFDEVCQKEGLVIGLGVRGNQEGVSKKVLTYAPDLGHDVQFYDPGMHGHAGVSIDPRVKDHDRLMKDLTRMGWSGEHFVVGMNEKGEKVVIAHPFEEMPASSFEAMLKAKVVASAKESGYDLGPEDVKLDFQQPAYFDPEAARRL